MGSASVGRIGAAAGMAVAVATTGILGSRHTVPDAESQPERRPQGGTNAIGRYQIVGVCPHDREVLGRINIAGLIDPGLLNDLDAVRNGIAYDADGGRIFVTGELWPWLFEVRFLENR